mgnify:CR=1 FL=1
MSKLNLNFVEEYFQKYNWSHLVYHDAPAYHEMCVQFTTNVHQDNDFVLPRVNSTDIKFDSFLVNKIFECVVEKLAEFSYFFAFDSWLNESHGFKIDEFELCLRVIFQRLMMLELLI